MARLLIVDDDPQMRSMLRETFVLKGFDVSIAEDGVEASRLHRDSPFDLIITDIVMPEKDGFELILELRQSHPGTKVIAISGGGRLNASDYLQSASKFGVVATFQKPVNRKELVAVVESAIGKPKPA